MSKPRASSILYRLVEVGQLTRHALARPLSEHGLEPGDDAVLLALSGEGSEERELAAEFGVEPAALEGHIRRLVDRNLLMHRGTRLALTDEGQQLRRLLTENWAELEDGLLSELKRKERKALRKMLSRFAGFLRF